MNAEELKEKRKELGLTQTEFGKLFEKVTMRTVQNWEGGVTSVPNYVDAVVERELQKLNAPNFVKESESEYTTGKQVGVPYYDIDFTAGFLPLDNSQQRAPDSYISHPFFKGCDYVIRASGQSMAKVIAHGDAIGLTRVNNWQEFFPYGEIYAIVTNDGFRMIKIITKGESNESFTQILFRINLNNENYFLSLL